MPDTNHGKQRTAVITGAGSGLGREVALRLAAKNYRVFGTALSTDDVVELDKESGGPVALSIVDVTDEHAVTAWATEVAHELGEAGVDLLVSNAGILTPGPLEVLDLTAIKREFDVNVFGGLSVINAFLPSLRTARGRIVLIGSMTGRFPIPFNGPSSASKATLEAIADVYRAELKPFGIDVVLAQPGNMRTGGPAKTAAALQQVADAMTDEQQALYGDAFAKFTKAINSTQGGGLSVGESAARVIELSEQTPAPIRGAVGHDAEEILRLVRELTDAELDALRLKLVGLSES